MRTSLTVAAAYTAFIFVHTHFNDRHIYIPSMLDSIVRWKFSLSLLGQTEVLLLNNSLCLCHGTQVISIIES